MKALILAAGRGRRMNGELHDEAPPKCLASVAERPLIHSSLDNAAAAAVSEIIIVVGDDADTIDRACGSKWDRIPIQFVHQHEPLGVVHAIECARDAIGTSDILLFLGDEFVIGGRHHDLRRELERGEVDAICGTVECFSAEELAGNYAVFADPKSGRIERLVEKPAVDDAPSRSPVLMGTGNCAIANRLLAYTERTVEHPLRGQREMPDWIQAAINDGCSVLARPVARRYVNVNTPQDLLLARALQVEAEAGEARVEDGSAYTDRRSGLQ